MTGIEVSAGFVAGIRGRATRRLEKRFLPRLRELLIDAPVLHADETPGRAAGEDDMMRAFLGQDVRIGSAADVDASPDR